MEGKKQPNENRTCPSGLEVGSFRNLPRPYTHTHTHIVQGRQHCQPGGDGLAGRICQSRISTSSSFQWCVFFSSRSDLQQTNPNGDWVAPPNPGVKVTHVSWWNIPLKFSVYNAFSRHDSVFSAAQQVDPPWALGQWLSCDFRIFNVLVILAAVPSLAYKVTDHNSRSFSNQSILK